MNHYFSTTLLEVECKGPQVVVVFGSVVSSLSFAFHRFLLTFSRRGSSSVKFKEKLIKKSNEDSFLIIAYFLNFFVYVLWPISGTCRTQISRRATPTLDNQSIKKDTKRKKKKVNKTPETVSTWLTGGSYERIARDGENPVEQPMITGNSFHVC